MKNANYCLTRSETNFQKSFSAVFNEKISCVIVNCAISPIETLGQINREKVISVKALWDSGSSGSAVTVSTAKKMGLIPIGKRDLYTHGGFRISNVYQVYFHLPNLITLPIEILDCEDCPEFGLIIGMDILCKGNFSIKNFNSQTAVSFEMPVTERIDKESSVTGANEPHKIRINGTDTIRTLNIEYQKIVNQIIIDCEISPCERSGQINNAKILPVKAILDTGAQISSVTRSMAKKAGLISVMRVTDIHGGGSGKSPVYPINIHLPNKEIIPIAVLESEDYSEFELVIGMDILSKGDFSIKNSDSRTVVTFKMPVEKL